MNEIASPSTPPRQTSASPPPKCAICLGTCTNKCFSDSCMHQFCFTCLLEWSKVKAECPLCKQSFKSIIHNIKSNDEYDEHFIEVPEVRGLMENDDAFLYLPPAPSRHFQFRTTFTVDPGGELAIQQMLLSHPLTNTLYNVPGNYLLPRQSRFGRLRHPRRASSATSFRRSIYMLNMWVYAPPDVTGRYRDISPNFYRENPASRNRLVPWLNRELNALLRENTQQVMHLVDVIMDHLPRWHIRSRLFKNLLDPYLTNKTDHFIHEFYNFMRSPFDMIGYDRHIVYSERPFSPTYSISDHDDDSDVAIVNISQPVGADNNPFRRPTIEVIEINSDSSHDSDVMIREAPAAEVVLVDSDTTDTVGIPERANQTTEEESEVNRKPILPLKIRLKHKRQSKEKRPCSKCCLKRCYSSSSHSSSSSDSSDSSAPSESLAKRYKRRHKHKKSKWTLKEHRSRKEKSKNRVKTAVAAPPSSSSEELGLLKKQDFDSDDNIPLSKIKSKEKQKKAKKNHQSTRTALQLKTHTVTSKNYSSSEDDTPLQNIVVDDEHAKPSCSRWKTSEVSNLNSYETSSSLTPINLSLPNNSLPSMGSGKYNFCSSGMHYDVYRPNGTNSKIGFVPQYDSMSQEHFQQYPQYVDARYNLPTVGNRYYDGPGYSSQRKSVSYTPPPAHNASFDSSSNAYSNLFYTKECLCGNVRDCSSCNRKYLYPNNIELPSRVNVGVGTSPIKNEVLEHDYSDYSAAGTSGNRRLQSVIVKKEEKLNLRLYDSSDTDS